MHALYALRERVCNATRSAEVALYGSEVQKIAMLRISDECVWRSFVTAHARRRLQATQLSLSEMDRRCACAPTL